MARRGRNAGESGRHWKRRERGKASIRLCPPAEQKGDERRKKEGREEGGKGPAKNHRGEGERMEKEKGKEDDEITGEGERRKDDGKRRKGLGRKKYSHRLFFHVAV